MLHGIQADLEAEPAFRLRHALQQPAGGRLSAIATL
jgi:hypothetical protein